MKTLKLVLTLGLTLCVLVITAQTKSFTGTVLDERGEPVIGASVLFERNIYRYCYRHRW